MLLVESADDCDNGYQNIIAATELPLVLLVEGQALPPTHNSRKIEDMRCQGPLMSGS